MKRSLSFLALSLATIGFVKAEYDVSKMGKDIQLVFEVSLPGASTPSVLYNKA